MSSLDNAVMKGNAPKDDLVMMLEPFNDLEARLGCAPLCINVLGQLCLIATKRDFSLRVPGSEFRHLTHPDSFRACLSQVAHEGYKAFLEADSSMECIRLHTNRVPELLKSALQILYGGATPQEISLFLPKKLEAIDEVANACVREVENVVSKFENVIETLEELKRQTMVMQGKTQQAKDEHDLKVQLEEKEKRHWETVTREKKEEVEALKKQVADAHRDWKDALDSMPGTGDLMLGAIVDGVSKVIDAGASAFQTVKPPWTMGVNAVGGINSNMSNGAGSNVAGSTGAVPPQMPQNAAPPMTEADKKLIEEAIKTKELVGNMLQYFEKTENGVGLLEKRVECGVDDVVKANDVKVSVEHILGKVKKLKGKKQNELMELIGTSIDLAKQVQRPQNPTTINDICNTAGTLFSTLDAMVAEGTKRMGVSQFQKSGPQPVQTQSKSSGMVQSMVENAHRKVEVTRAELNSLRETSRDATKQGLDMQRQLQESMAKLESYKDVVATSSEILIIIQEGLTAFAQLKSQWENLHQFFKSMSNLIKASLSPEINLFVKEAAAMQKLEAPSRVAKEVVYKTAYQAVKTSAVVHHLSDAYCNISKKHLMPLTLELDKMLVLDKERDAAEIGRRKLSLRDGADKANKAIVSIIKAKHENFLKKSEERINTIDAELRQMALPPLPPQKKAAITAEAERIVETVNAEVVLDDFC